MIRIEISKNDEYILKVSLIGHAKYADYGNDIVCASVSSIAITTVNSILKISSDAINYTNDDGLLVIEIKKYDRVINILMKNMIDLFKELEEDYPKNIKIIFN